ncbi:MAG: hypothetical protein A2X94_10945 [Bdellovibrionales bacterium GWB1_55_8]|nr:MAG: hypothetical protein A2X94_10945 [Bdellovibrionales bacterium GWB1_55_8]
MSNWLQFIKERFEPVSHLALISLFVAAHWVVAEALLATSIGLPALITVFIGALTFFFKLRLYDEIKDYEVDIEFNPTRPLARGLLKIADMKRGIAVCIVIELVAFGSRGSESLVAAAVAIGYSLLMYKEFFIGTLIRPLLTTYAVSHTFVSVLLSLTLLIALGDGGLGLAGTHGKELLLFALNSWCLFNVFEFGRKTFFSEEERARVPSYSKVFGRAGAVVLVLGMAGMSLWLLLAGQVLGGMTAGAVGVAIALLAASGIILAIKNGRPFGSLYRALTSVYILAVYAIVIVARRCGC